MKNNTFSALSGFHLPTGFNAVLGSWVSYNIRMFRYFLLLLCIVFAVRSSAQQVDTSGHLMLPYQNYYQVRHNINNALDHILHKKEVTIAFLGGSITFNPGWRPMLCDYLRQRFPDTRFRFIAAGIPSLGSLPHAFRLQRDVLDSGRVDLMFIEAAVNDRVNGTDSLTQVRDLEGIVRHARKSNPQMDMILMEFADPYKNADYDKGITPAEIANHELIAGHYGLPSINLAKEVHDKMANHEFSWEKDFQDLHPAIFGQRLYFNSIKALFEDCLKQYYPLKKAAGNYALPGMLDKHSFENGRYVEMDKAKYTSGWTLTNDWTPSDRAGTRPGFVHVPVLQNTQTDAELMLTFRGNAVGIAIVSGPDAGIISYSIDNGPYLQKDLFTQWSSGLHLPWYLLLGSGLIPGEHVLHLKVSAQKNDQSKGNVCRIVHFLCNGNPAYLSAK